MGEVERLSTGCPAIDELLEGGFERASVTQVYGPPASGKTNLVLTAAVQTMLDGDRVLYIDTEGFSPDRLEQILRGHGSEVSPDVTDRMVVTHAYDFSDQRSAIQEVGDVAHDLDLVILDSATGFYRLERTLDSTEGDALRAITHQIAQLLGLARKHRLAIVITNQVFADPDADRVRPLGGHTLAHWSGTILRLDRFRGGRRRATLEKHRSLPAGDSAEFEITEDGLTNAGSGGLPPYN